MTSSPLSHIKPSVRALSAYTLKHYQPRIKLNQNESPYDVPAELKARLQGEMTSRPWNRYPPFVAESFIGAVSEAMDWPADGVLVANGSNELIQATLAVMVGPGVSVVIPEPTFTLYRLMTEVGGGIVVPVPLDADLRFDVDGIIEAGRGSNAAAVVLCSPNNPTGSALTREEILRIHDETDALIILDQAYVEFGGFDARALLPGRPRMVLLRTFSKAMALAGLRAGYLLGDSSIVREVNKAKLPYNINFFTEAVAAGVLRNRELLQPQIETMRAQCRRIQSELARLPGLRVFPSAANFVLFRVEAQGLDQEAVFMRLLEGYGILIRDVSKYPMLAGCLRVNAGTPEETGEFLAAMSEILRETTP